MQKLIFFSRVAFICNVCFVLAWVMRYYPNLKGGEQNLLLTMVLVLGILVSFLLNILVNGFILSLILQFKPVWDRFPRWLIITNFLFLFFQIILISK